MLCKYSFYPDLSCKELIIMHSTIMLPRVAWRIPFSLTVELDYHDIIF